MQKFKGHLTAALFGILAGAMLAYPQQAADAAQQALTLWARAVVPVLGPFMVCAVMLSGRLGSSIAPGVVTAWLCGSPGGAKIFQSFRLSRKNALHYAAVTGTMSPMFFLGTVSGWLGNPAAGLIIFLCHITGAFITGLFFPMDKTVHTSNRCSPVSLSAALQSCAPSLCVIALCMMMGAVSARMVQCALPTLPDAAMAALQCILEVTAGAHALLSLRPPFLMPLLCAACSFSGLSILLQNAVCWRESGLTPANLVPIRLIHAVISGILCLLLTLLLPHIAACAFSGFGI